MDSRTLEVWRLTWPKAIPAHEYETALMLAGLIATTGQKPQPAPAPTVAASAGPPDELVDIKEAARILGLTANGLYARLAGRRMSSIRTGHKHMFSRAELERELALPAGTAPDDLVSMPEALRILGYGPNSPSVLRRRISAGEFKTHRKPGEGRRTFLSRNELLRAKRARPRSDSPAAPVSDPPVSDPMNASQAAAILGISKSTITRLLESGQLKTTSKGEGRARRHVISRADLEAYRAAQAAAAANGEAH